MPASVTGLVQLLNIRAFVAKFAKVFPVHFRFVSSYRPLAIRMLLSPLQAPARSALPLVFRTVRTRQIISNWENSRRNVVRLSSSSSSIHSKMSSVQPPRTTTASTGEEKPWHADFPTPTSSLKDNSLSSITVSELREKVKQQSDLSKRDFLVVDVRRTDFEVRTTHLLDLG